MLRYLCPFFKHQIEAIRRSPWLVSELYMMKQSQGSDVVVRIPKTPYQSSTLMSKDSPFELLSLPYVVPREETLKVR
jgi:hypothetical protein